ncbi:glycosyltransferase [Neobacillus soli]|uniref:glycosyltransferase n=1 Tax=Neobacillus soli TaxID=220688 RepID=UPI000825E4B0|nr:glycosyltransferase [Neobacillus soli]
MPKLSVIVPIYNVEEFLPNCIDSILEQTFTNFELILVNDGSPDNCGKICDFYAKKDNRINVIHKTNGGVSSARNIGIEISKGEYIAFVDPDDTIEPNMYDVLLKAAIKYEADIVVCPYNSINLIDNTTSISSVWNNGNCSINKETIHKQLLPLILVDKTYSLISSVNKVYKKSVLDSLNIKFDENKYHSEDERFNILLLTMIKKLVCIEKPFYNYFIRKRDSLTRILRENLYKEYVLDNKNFKIGLCKKYGLQDYIDKVRNYYIGVTLLHIQNVISRNIPNKHKSKIISEILNDNEFNEDMINYKFTTNYGKLLKIICIYRKASLLLFIINLRIKLNDLKKGRGK